MEILEQTLSNAVVFAVVLLLWEIVKKSVMRTYDYGTDITELKVSLAAIKKAVERLESNSGYCPLHESFGDQLESLWDKKADKESTTAHFQEIIRRLDLIQRSN